MIAIKPIKIRDEHKPLICLITQLLFIISLATWCFGIAVVAKEPTLINLFFGESHMLASGGAIIGSMTGLMSTLFFCYKLTYKYSKQDWEQNQLRAMGSGLFDKETHLSHKEMLIRFEQAQLSMEEKAKMKEMEISKKLKNLETMKKKGQKNEK